MACLNIYTCHVNKMAAMLIQNLVIQKANAIGILIVAIGDRLYHSFNYDPRLTFHEGVSRGEVL